MSEEPFLRVICGAHTGNPPILAFGKVGPDSVEWENVVWPWFDDEGQWRERPIVASSKAGITVACPTHGPRFVDAFTIVRAAAQHRREGWSPPIRA